jgi:hypothetical protein
MASNRPNSQHYRSVENIRIANQANSWNLVSGGAQENMTSGVSPIASRYVSRGMETIGEILGFLFPILSIYFQCALDDCK